MSISKADVEIVLSARDQASDKVKEFAVNAEKSLTKLEKSFETLKIQSSAQINDLKNRINHSFDVIKSSAEVTNADIIRAEQAKNKMLADLDGQHVNRKISVIEKIKQNWLGLSASVYAVQAALSKAWEYADVAAKFEEQQAGLNALTAQYGITADEITRSVQEVVDGQLSLVESSGLASRALLLGLNPDQVRQFVQYAERLTDVAGGEIPDAFEAMEKAAATGRSKGLVQYGIMVDLNKSLEDYAKKHGVVKDSIDQHTAMQVRANAILEASKEKTDALGAAQESTADKMNKLRATVADAQLIMGQFAIRGGAALIGTLQGISAAAWTVFAGVMKMGQGFAYLLSMVPGPYQKQWKSTYASIKVNADAAWQTAVSQAQKGEASLKLAIAPKESLRRAMAPVKGEYEDGGGSGSGKGGAGKSSKADQALKQLEDQIKAMQREKELIQATTHEEEMRWEVSAGKYKNLNEERKQGLIVAARELDIAEAEKKSAQDKAVQIVAIEREIEALRQESDAFGMTATQLKLYEMAQKGATEQQLQSAEVLLKGNEQHRQLTRVLEDLKTPLDEYAEKMRILNELKTQGLLNDDQYKEAVTKYKTVLQNAGKDQLDILQSLKQSIDGWGKNATDTLIDFATGGKVSFKDFADSVIKDILRMIIQYQIMIPLMKSAFGADGNSGWAGTAIGVVTKFFGSAQGNVFSGGRLIPFAQGGIVDRPVVFRMAQGMGLMGEAGPEAVMPLARLPGGDLGVKTTGTPKEKAPVPQNIRIINVLDPGIVENWASSAAGERVIMNVIRRNQ